MKRLKPEYRVKLQLCNREYPHLLKRTIEALNEKVIYGDLKVTDAYNLSAFLTDHAVNIHDLNDVIFDAFVVEPPKNI
tara:strand:+ start:9287 stop:9520 length:234 start_codon:yes stop_codon:yes gene_type:complete